MREFSTFGDGEKCTECDYFEIEMEILQKENKKLKECLEFYADNSNWLFDSLSGQDGVIRKSDRSKSNEYTIQDSGGKRARQCLKELK